MTFGIYGIPQYIVALIFSVILFINVNYFIWGSKKFTLRDLILSIIFSFGGLITAFVSILFSIVFYLSKNKVVIWEEKKGGDN